MIFAIILGLLACVGVTASYILAMCGSSKWSYLSIFAAIFAWALCMLTFAGVLIYRALT